MDAVSANLSQLRFPSTAEVDSYTSDPHLLLHAGIVTLFLFDLFINPSYSVFQHHQITKSPPFIHDVHPKSPGPVMVIVVASVLISSITDLPSQFPYCRIGK